MLRVGRSAGDVGCLPRPGIDDLCYRGFMLSDLCRKILVGSGVRFNRGTTCALAEAVES